MNRALGAFCALLAVSFAFGPEAGAQGPAAAASLPDGLYARFSTAKGEVIASLEFEKAPLTVGNFVGLAEGLLNASKGRRYYDGLSFHRVEPGFVVQGGDPRGDGSGGPGYRFPDEIVAALVHDGEGVLSMANAGPNTNGSQFFITLGAAPWLDGLHAVFGRVVSGMETVKAIAAGDRIERIDILRFGERALDFKADQASWNERAQAILAAARRRAFEKRQADLALVAKLFPEAAPDAVGIFQATLAAGSGPVIAKGALASVAYKGSLLDGTVFDAAGADQAFEFQVGSGQVIRGWDRAVSTMRVGEKRLVVLPPEFAYGEKGAGGVIPPNAFLVFEIELLAVK